LEIVTNKISNIDKKNIEKYLGLVYRNSFENSLLKLEYKGNYFFGFPFLNSNKVIGYKYFSYGYKNIFFKSGNAFWKFETNIIVDVDFLIISDEPVSVLKYYSSRYEFFKNKSVLGFVPKNMSKDLYDKIISDYVIQNIITVFDNPSNKELMKIRVLVYSSGENVLIKKKDDKYIVLYKKRGLVFQKMSYAFFRKKMNLKTIVKHKINKS